MTLTYSSESPETSQEATQEQTIETVILTEKAVLVATQLVRELTQGENCVLIYLDSLTEDATAVEIADQVALTRPRITQIVSDLESRGLVVRTKDTEDRRKVNIRITDAGRRLVQKQREQALDGFNSFLEELGDDDDAFIRILHKTIDHFEEKYGIKIA
ncbi:MAG: winged helix-turn-helix transcriptional regulator [Atopobiaceae bacterium]|nr:winged helix-turn-helix transcriptional regulator [Atopobiaceae bacterium]